MTTRNTATQTTTEPEMQRWNAGLYVGLEIHIGGAAAVENDGIALGAALADLQREGWSLDSLERDAGRTIVKAMLRRSWPVHGREPLPDGERSSMSLSDGASQ